MDATVMRFLWLALFYLVGFLILRLAIRRSTVLSRHPVGFHLLIVTAGLYLFLTPLLRRLHIGAEGGLLAMALFLSVTVALRFLEAWYFERLQPRKGRASVPQVVRDILRWLLLAVALMLIVRMIFPGANLNVLAFSSIVVGYILGNASQDTLGNLISGLALNTESPFSIGDWVEIAGHRGRVVDMTWRATSLRTRLHDYIILPNAVIARDPIINYSRPTQVHGIRLPVGVNYAVAPNVVRRALLEALHSVPDVLATPLPEVRLKAYSDFSIDYEMRFFMRDYTREERIKSDVMDRVWYVFRREGIVIPFPIRDVNLRQVSAEDEHRESEQRLAERLALLAGIDLLQPLSETERHHVAGNLSERIYGAGEILVKEGDTGADFFIIVDGRVRITRGPRDRQTMLANLEAGQVFGEMSLLTGEPRNATVSAETDTRVLVLAQAVLGEVLAGNSALAEALADVLAARRRREAQVRAAAGPVEASPPEPSKSVLLAGIRRFFRLPA